MTGRLLHPNQSPVGNQGVHLKGDNWVGKDNAKHLTENRTDGNGYFSLFAVAPKNGRCYLNAVQKDGSLLRISEVFHVTKNGIIDVGDIVVSW